MYDAFRYKWNLVLCGEREYPSYLYKQYYIKFLHLFVFGVAKFDENVEMDNPYFRYFRISPMEIPSMFYDLVEVAPDASEGID